MLQKLLCVCLLTSCVIGCTIEAPDDGNEESLVPTPPVLAENQMVDVVENANECLSDFHGEHISGELISKNSERKTIRVNKEMLIYYYTLNLMLSESTFINIVLEEAVLAHSEEVGWQILNGDFLLVKLDNILEPGTWKEGLVKNLTRNITF